MHFARGAKNQGRIRVAILGMPGSPPSRFDIALVPLNCYNREKSQSGVNPAVLPTISNRAIQTAARDVRFLIHAEDHQGRLPSTDTALDEKNFARSACVRKTGGRHASSASTPPHQARNSPGNAPAFGETGSGRTAEGAEYP